MLLAQSTSLTVMVMEIAHCLNALAETVTGHLVLTTSAEMDKVKLVQETSLGMLLQLHLEILAQFNSHVATLTEIAPLMNVWEEVAHGQVVKTTNLVLMDKVLSAKEISPVLLLHQELVVQPLSLIATLMVIALLLNVLKELANGHMMSTTLQVTEKVNNAQMTTRISEMVERHEGLPVFRM